MPSGVSPVFGLFETPVGQVTAPPGPVDDWKWSEGRPPKYGSPLIPVAYIPWHRMRWAAEPVIAPKLTFQGMIPDATENKKYTLASIINNPSYITDHHIISLRKMVEQLFSPKIKAHIHLELDGEIFVKPLYQMSHGNFKAADVYEWWPSLLNTYGDGPDKPYVFSIGGFVSNHGGHVHTWNAGASGYNKWTAKLHLHHGGAIWEEIGNYEIIKIEYSYITTKYYRKVYSQDGDLIFSGDYDSFTRKVHLQLYDSFEGKWLLGYAVDVGEYWSTPGNTNISYPGGIPSITPKYYYLANQWNPGNIIMSSCMLPYREVMGAWFGGGKTHDPVTPYNILYNHAQMQIYGQNRFIALSVYASTLGTSIPIDDSVQYFEKRIVGEWTEIAKDNPRFEKEYTEADVVTTQPGGGAGSKWVQSLIGTTFQPMFRITFKDMNNNIRTYTVTETEFYHKNISYLDGEKGQKEPS